MKQSDETIPTYDVFLGCIGKRIMDLRIKKHYTRKHLAKMADISEKFLYEIEFGKKGCSGYNLYRLAKSLNTGMDDLTEYDAFADGDFSIRKMRGRWDETNRGSDCG